MRPCSGDMKGTPATARATASNVSSGPSRDVALERPAAGAARQGRRPAGIPLVFQGSRTPPGGDRRSPISGETLREGPLVLPRRGLGLPHLGVDGGPLVARIALDALLERLDRALWIARLPLRPGELVERVPARVDRRRALAPERDRLPGVGQRAAGLALVVEVEVLSWSCPGSLPAGSLPPLPLEGA